MSQWTISEVGRKVGLRSSAIRYYEQIGILEPARRVSGQRRYDETVLYRLAVVRRARDAGFTLDEIRQLFFGFSRSTPISQRWKRIAEHKMVELDARIKCETVERCGAWIYSGGLPGS